MKTLGKRAAMTNRKRLVSTFWLTSSLTLLALALVAPIRTSGIATASSRPDCLRRNFALTLAQRTIRLSAAIATDDVLEDDALLSEDEEQDRAVAADEPRVTFLLPYSFR